MKTITIDGVEYNLTPIEKQSNPIILKQILDFEVYPEDLGQHNWEDAKKICAVMGDGWRLPTREELHLIWLNRKSIGSFAAAYYWSSSENLSGNAWSQGFAFGSHSTSYKYSAYYVRAVRNIVQFK